MHNRRSVIIALMLSVFGACSEPEGFKKPEDGLDAASSFVRATLDGDYAKAERYVMRDEEDLRLFERYKVHMKQVPEKERLGLKSANMIIDSVRTPSDSVTLVHYSNTFHRQSTRLRAVRIGGEWWIDFSDTFGGAH
ncbi:MAG: hypothetical protein LW694_10165 [Chitinophagaceae bacterium]|jgi:hypothetical protein|nr:hypothetical protein [Chitinophagaceae bacterium]